MKNYLRNYLTPNEQKVLMLILAIGFISLLAISNPFNALYSDEVSPDSIRKDIQEPYKLIIDVRTASKDELTLIKGIGNQTADKIIAYRDSVDVVSNYDLLQIKGIGEKGLAKLMPFLKPLANDTLHYNKTNIDKVQTQSGINKMDLNKATLTDVMKVKGVGEVKAKQIIEFRDKHNGLDNMQELLSIKGIGKKTLAKIKELFYLGLD
jgi:competence protein ComEA